MEATTHNIERAIRALKAGEAIILPTDTVYGLGVSVEHARSPEILYDLKQRDHGKPVAWLVAGTDALDTYGKAIPEFAYALARTFWPGQLTLIVKASDRVPAAYKAANGTIALRMPDSPIARALIEGVGSPLATTSANISGQASTRSFDSLDPRLCEAVGIALSDNQVKSGIASTVVSCADDHPVVIREGSLPISDIMAHI